MEAALVHDWLIHMGGAEKVLEALAERFKGPIYTLLKEEKNLEMTPFASREIHSSFLQKIPGATQYYKNLTPLFPSAIERFDLSDHRLIISSSFAVAKSVRKRPGQLHICYCHTPFRAAWDLHDFYLSTFNLPIRLMAKPVLRYIRKFDQKTHPRVDHFIANSNYVARRIKEHYGREAKVIHPPVDVDLFAISKEKEEYYITCSRLVPYKRVDLLVAAFAKMPKRKLLIVGEGEDRRRLQSKATKNVEFLGHISHENLRTLLPKARAFLFAAEEDFGIVMVEAQAAGVPVIAFGKGGSTDAVLPGRTGLFFQKQMAQAIQEAVERFEMMEGDFEPEKIRAHALTFSKERFQNEMSDFIKKCGGR